MEKLSKGQESLSIARSAQVGLSLLGLDTAAAGRDSAQDLLSAVISMRDSVEGRFGLSSDQRIAVVLEATGARESDDAAKVLDLPPDRHRRLLAEARERLSANRAQRVVILEDDWFARRRLEDTCAQYHVAVAASTADPDLAVAAAVAYRPGVAFIDLDINGDQLAGEIAAMAISERCPDTKVVLVTGYDSADRIAALMPNSEALVKPVSSSALERVLKGESAA